MSNKILFDFAVDQGIIDASGLETLYKEMENAKYLEMHFGAKYKIQKGKDGRFFTRLPNGKQVRKADKSEFIEEVVQFYKGQNNIKLQDVFNDWIEFKYEYDGITQGTYDRTLSDFHRFFINNPAAKEIMTTTFGDIDEDELELFVRRTIRDMSLTTKSWQKLKSLISGIWLFGLKHKTTDLYITKFFDSISISPKLFRPKIEDERTQVFMDDEVKMILNEINTRSFSVHNYAIALCFYTGMRSGEIAGLMWQDISKDMKSITVRHTEVFYKDRDNKGATKYEVVDHAKTLAGLRTVVIPQALIPYLKKLKEETGEYPYVFTFNGKRIHAQNISDKLAKICKQLNIPPRRMHKIRKTVCSKLCDSGVDERLMLKQIGHTDRRTTEIYYHRDRRTEDEKRSILDRVIAY